jgi:hypothetical protein
VTSHTPATSVVWTFRCFRPSITQIVTIVGGTVLQDVWCSVNSWLTRLPEK